MGIKMTPEQEELTKQLFALDRPTLPETIGECVDLAYRMREKRLDLERKVKEMRADEDLLKQHIFDKFGEAGVEGARGRVAFASINRLVVAQVTDWDQLFRHVSNQDEWELLHRRVNDKAYREALEHNEVVPGVQPFVKLNLSLTKK